MPPTDATRHTDGIIRVEIVSFSDLAGGAARAAFRLMEALNQLPNLRATMLVQYRVSDDHRVRAFSRSLAMRALRSVLRPTVSRLSELQRSPSAVRSLALIPSGLPGSTDPRADIVHLHWVNSDMLSIREIGRIRGPVVWTLHDTWPFSGSEHYPYSISDNRFSDGYAHHTRPLGHSGWDLDRWTWLRKRKHWQRPIHLVCPSRWMRACAQASPLTVDWPTSVIPNPLDTEIFKPLDRPFCRAALGLPQDVRLILFGALRGIRDPRKGFDLLHQALERLRALTLPEPVEFVVFGQGEPEVPPQLGAPVHWMGMLHDDVTLSLLYNAADLFVLPSRQENLPQTATEAQACGCPVVAFNVCGVADVVQHDATGYLAEAYDTEALAHGMAQILRKPDYAAALGTAARERAVKLWSYSVIAPQFLQMYRELLGRRPGGRPEE